MEQSNHHMGAQSLHYLWCLWMKRHPRKIRFVYLNLQSLDTNIQRPFIQHGHRRSLPVLERERQWPR